MALLAIHDVGKTYAPETYLVNMADAQARVERLEKYFEKTRVSVSNIRIMNHPDIRVLDIVEIDLRMPDEKHGVPRNVGVLSGAPESEAVVFGGWPGSLAELDTRTEGRDAEEYRAFGGKMKGKVMSVDLDPETMISTISVLEV
jgi:hypothetical protein